MDEQDAADIFNHAWTSKSVSLMLDLYVERLEDFRNPLILKKTLWKAVKIEMEKAGFEGLTWKGMGQKMRNLKGRYLKVKQRTGKAPRWEFYPILDKIFSEPSVGESTSKTEVIGETMGADETTDYHDNSIQELSQDMEYQSDSPHLDSMEIASHADEERETSVLREHKNAIELVLRHIDEANRIHNERDMILSQILNKLK